VRRRYPLESLRSLRREQVDESTAKLGRERQRLDETIRERKQAERTRQEEEDRARKVLALERERLVRGALRASDLSQTEDWARGAEVRAQRLRQAEARATSEERTQAVAVERARSDLAEAEAKAEAVARHRERWQMGEARIEELKAEDQAMDGWTVRELVRSGRNKERP
jgi:flagellar biosynthesis chaperone FliJ